MTNKKTASVTERQRRAAYDIALASRAFLVQILKEHFGEKLDQVDLAGNAVETKAKCRHVLCKLEEKFGERIKGQPEMVHVPMLALILNEHVLLEGLPGVGKTEIVKWVAHVTGLPFKRVQFIPDMLPSDLVGKDRIDPVKLQQGEPNAVRWVNGPLFTSVLLADEINRAPSKVQAALLEAMGENQITPLGQVSRVVSSPIHLAAATLWWHKYAKGGKGLLGLPPIPVDRKDLVQFSTFATMNPIEQEGTYPLSEAQVDRFAFKVVVPYPPEASYHDIAAVVFGGDKPPEAMEPELELADYIESLARNEEGLLAVLAPVYFFLLCRSFLTPLAVGEGLVHESPMFDPRRPLRELGTGVERIYQIVLLTNAKTPSEEGLVRRTSLYAEKEQVDLRRFLGSPPGKDLRTILECRHCQYVLAGASPRGFLKLLPAALCEAFLAGRDHVEDEDIRTVVHSILRHRIHMDVHARLERISPTEVIDAVADRVLTS